MDGWMDRQHPANNKILFLFQPFLFEHGIVVGSTFFGFYFFFFFKHPKPFTTFHVYCKTEMSD